MRKTKRHVSYLGSGNKRKDEPESFNSQEAVLFALRALLWLLKSLITLSRYGARLAPLYSPSDHRILLRRSRKGLSINPHFHSASTRPRRKTEYEGRKDAARLEYQQVFRYNLRLQVHRLSPVPHPIISILISCLPFFSQLFSLFSRFFFLNPSCISWWRLYSYLEFLLYVFDYTGRQRHNCTTVHRAV